MIRSVCLDQLAAAIWVEAPFDVTVRRAVRRDAAGRDETVVEAKYHCRYVPGQVMYLTRCRPKEAADVIVHNADVDNPHLEFSSSSLGFQP